MNFCDYQVEHGAEVMSLLSTYTNVDYENNTNIWDWIFTENPVLDGDTQIGISIVEDDAVIGFNGLMPIKIQYKDQEVLGAWSFNTILSPACRGKGLGGKLVAEVKASYPIVLGLGISDIQASIMRKYGYHVNEDIQRFFLHKRADSIRSVARIAVQSGIKLKHSARLRKSLQKERALTTRIIDAKDAPVEIDALWDQIKGSYTNIVVRDQAYIKWKYGGNPQTPHSLILVEDDDKQLCGLGVVALVDGMSCLMDFVGDAQDFDTKYQVINEFVNDASESDKLECTCSDQNLKDVLEAFGFRAYKDKPRFYVHSNLTDDSNPEQAWFVMGGDSD